MIKALNDLIQFLCPAEKYARNCSEDMNYWNMSISKDHFPIFIFAFVSQSYLKRMLKCPVKCKKRNSKAPFCYTTIAEKWKECIWADVGRTNGKIQHCVFAIHSTPPVVWNEWQKFQ